MKEKPKTFNNKTCLILKLEYDVSLLKNETSYSNFNVKQFLLLKDFVFF